ncbi:MAG: MIT C-terminal domain-containing protein [Verrucomicrobiota bacterium]|nr:MIT C-terminal domain-containing protein [Verrucomicrobiota bacterium]
MSMLLVHELHEARDRILLLRQQLTEAREREISAYHPFLNEQIELLSKALAEARIPERYRVAVVGRFKVGKSSFVNKLADERLAGVDTNPETAAISVFRYDSQARAEVELISKEAWDRLAADHAEDPKSPDVKRYDRFVTFNERAARRDNVMIDLSALANQWVVAGGKSHPVGAQDWDSKAGKKAFLAEIRKFTTSQEPLHYLVNKLTIYAPIPILRDQIELIDTPGLDDTERFRVLLTEDLVKDVDAILFLTVSGASYGQGDKEFIIRQLRRKQIKHLQLIVTKCDETFENAVHDAKENDETPPTYQEFCVRESRRVRTEAKATLDELLQSNQLTDEEGYYYIEQLDNVPVHLISAKYHQDGDAEKGGIDGVRDGLYRILSTSQRFEQSRTVLNGRLEMVLGRLRRSYSERLNTLEMEFDPAKVRAEIESIRTALSKNLDAFGERSGEALGLLAREQEAFFATLPAYLDQVTMHAKEVLTDLERTDLVKHWKTRRCGRWGYLVDLQAKIADRVFPKVEARLNALLVHLDTFMEKADAQLKRLQDDMAKIESEHHLAGLEPVDLAASQAPMFESLRKEFHVVVEAERDGIVNNMDEFVSSEVQERLDTARESVSNVFGSGTTIRQGSEVTSFYSNVRSLLAKALGEHLELRIREFASAIHKTAGSVAPRIRESSEGVLIRRLEAIESSLQVAAEGQKEHVESYLGEMLALLENFAVEPVAVDRNEELLEATKGDAEKTALNIEPKFKPIGLVDQHYEISEGATGYPYERIFRPYIDTATRIEVDEPFVRLPYQVDNFTRFCALAVRLGKVKNIKLTTGLQPAEPTNEVDSRLETLRRDLNTHNIELTWNHNYSLHDREIRFDNGWVVKIGRGLDMYNKPESWVSVEAADFTLRRCRQTKVDVFRSQ